MPGKEKPTAAAPSASLTPIRTQAGQKKSTPPKKEKKRDNFPTPKTVGGRVLTASARKIRRLCCAETIPERASATFSGTTNPDLKGLREYAWEIFLAEVSEEGLALMDDATASETARRAFRIAEIFLTEAATHHPAATQDKRRD